MAFDPSIISQIPDGAPNIPGAIAQGYKLADMQTAAQANRLQLGQQQRQVADNEKARNILKGVKLDSPRDVTRAAEKLSDAGLPDHAMQFMKTIQGLRESKGSLELQQYQLMASKANILGGSTAGLVLQYDQMVQSGVSPALAMMTMQPRYQELIRQLSQTKLPDGTSALNEQDLAQIRQHPTFDADFVRSIAQRSQQGAAALQAQMQFHSQKRADDIAGIRAKAETRMEEDERRKVMLAEETLRENREKDKRAREGIPDKLTPDALELAGHIVMVDPSQMSKFAGRTQKDPRMGQINEWIAAKLKESGMSWQDLERLRQNFKSESKSVDKLTGQLNGIESFEGLARANGERVLELIKMIDDTKVPLIEGFRRSATRKLGGIDESELASVLSTFQFETAKIIGGNPNMTGVVTDSARKDVQAMAPQSMTAKQAERIINRLFTEMDIRKEQIENQIGKAQEHSFESTPMATAPARTPSGQRAPPQQAAPPQQTAPGAAPAPTAAPPTGPAAPVGAGGSPPGLPPGFVVDK